MTILYINTGSSPNSGDGDTLRTSFNKINANFATLSTLTNSSTINLLAVEQDIIPAVDSFFNLGSTSHQWKSLYVSTETIYIANVPLTIDTVSHALLVNGQSIQPSSWELTSSTSVTLTAGSSNPLYWWAEFGDFNIGSTGTFGVGVVHDPSGNLWAFGNVLEWGTGANTDTLALKYDQYGNLLWQASYRDSNNLNSVACASNDIITFDNAGNAYYLANDEDNNLTYVGKMDSNGNTVNQELFYTSGYAVDMTFDNNNHMLLAGTRYNYYNTVTTNTYNIPYVMKLDESYNVLWQIGIDVGTDGSSYNGNGEAIAVDSTGNSYVVGYYQPGAGGYAGFISKINTNGILLWSLETGIPISGNPDEYGYSAGINNGHLYVLNYDYQSYFNVITKYDLNGNQIWQRVSDDYRNTPLEDYYVEPGYDLNFDSSGNIYITSQGGGDINGNTAIILTKMEPTAGTVVYQRALLSANYSLDNDIYWWAGHRQASIFDDRIAISAYTTYSAPIGTGTNTAFAFTIQMPIDGSVVGTFDGITVSDVTAAFSTSTYAGTYTNTVTSFAAIVTTATATTGTLAPVTVLVTGTNTLTNYTYELGKTWTFSTTGTMSFPDGTEQITAWNTGTSVHGSQIVGGFNTLTFSSTASITDSNGNVITQSYFGGNSTMPNIAIGRKAGPNPTDGNTIAIGYQAGQAYQAGHAIAIGARAGKDGQGDSAIAIGNQAAGQVGGGGSPQSTSSIVISALGLYNPVYDAGPGTLVIKPIRNDRSPGDVLYYNVTSGEITYGTAPSVTTSTLVNGTYSVELDSNGIFNLSTASTIVGQGTDPNVYIETVTTNTTSTWTFGTNGILTLPADTPIIQGGGSGTDVTIIATTGSNTSTWTFGSDGVLQSGNINITGSLAISGQNNLNVYNTNDSAVIDFYDSTTTNSIISVGSSGNLAGGPGSLNLITHQDNPLVFYQDNSEAGRITSGQEWIINNLSTINLTVTGIRTVVSSTNLVVDTPIIYLAEANPGNSYDIGIIGHFVQSPVGYQHTGLFRKASENKWYLASGIKTEPTNQVATTDSTFTPDTLELGTLIATTGVQFSDATVQSTAWTGSTSTLVNGTFTVTLNTSGSTILPVTPYDLNLSSALPQIEFLTPAEFSDTVTMGYNYDPANVPESGTFSIQFNNTNTNPNGSVLSLSTSSASLYVNDPSSYPNSGLFVSSNGFNLSSYNPIPLLGVNAGSVRISSDVSISTQTALYIQISNDSASHNYASPLWKFYAVSTSSGAIQFPDATVQTTAWTGTIASLPFSRITGVPGYTTTATVNTLIANSLTNFSATIRTLYAGTYTVSLNTSGVLTAPSLTVSGTTTLTSISTATSTNTGALQVAGGVGIGGNLYTGGNINAGTNSVTAGSFVGSGSQLTGVAAKTTGSWTLSTGANTVSLTVPLNGTYAMWVNGNIPNGIVTWNATAVITNPNVPALGTQYAWYYPTGNNLVFTSIPNQFVGTSGVISSSTAYAGTSSNVFTFGITNNTTGSQIVNWGYTKL